jgi:sortase A
VPKPAGQRVREIAAEVYGRQACRARAYSGRTYGKVSAVARRQAEQVNAWITRRDVRSLLPYGLIVAGLVVLLYVGTQYGLMVNDQHKLEQQWAMQNSAPAASLNQASTSTDDTLVRITIPKINVDAIVVEGTTGKQLMRGPGHIRSSAYPGEQGNVVISAHRDTFFRHLVELKNGDQIQLQRGGTTYTYEVTGKKITDPNDISVIQQTDEPRLTLITCYPTYYIGPAPERLVVFSRLVSPVPAKEAAITTVSSSDVSSDRTRTRTEDPPKPE